MRRRFTPLNPPPALALTQGVSRFRLLRLIAVAGLLLICGLQIILVIRYAAEVLPLGGDARSYIAAARAIIHGQAPIGANVTSFLPEAGPDIPVYLYPPFLALLLVPLGLLPYSTALIIWLVVVLVATLALIPLLRPLVGWAAASAGVLFFLPTWQSLWLGQVNALIAVALALALLACLRGQEARAGLSLTIGALLKITPLIALLVLARRRHWRAVAAAGATAAVVVVLSLPFVSLEAWYSGSLYALTNTWTSPLLLSWTAILRRQPGLVATAGPLALSALMLALTLIRSRAGTPLLSLAAAYILPLLISGIVWQYQALVALPALAVLWHHSTRGRAIAFATWLAISLLGGIWQPVTLTLCWVVCCWPQLLGTPDAVPGSEAA
ncbi:MAG: glycosyltransferase family 87 protein [Roseiflexaceae bacterium]